MNVLFIGDIVGRKSRNFAFEKINNFKKNKDADVIVVNVENSAGGFGITPEICNDFLNAGADVLTTGNHVWDKKEIIPYINKSNRVLRPLNMIEGTPGKGLTIVETDHGLIGVANIMTNLFMPPTNPVFECLQNIIETFSVKNNLILSLIDVHGEATSEKVAIGFYLDGHVTAVLGTHTHIPTADWRVLEKGTAYITDVGMSGDYDSVIGMQKQSAIPRFLNLNKKKLRLEVSLGEPTLCGVLIKTKKDGLAKSIRPIRIGGCLNEI